MHLIKYGFGVLLLCGLVFWYVKKPAAQEDQNILNVGTNAEYQPFSFLDNNDEIVGLDIDIAKEVCNRLGKKCVLHSLSFDALIPEIQLGTIHMIAAGITVLRSIRDMLLIHLLLKKSVLILCALPEAV